MIITDFMKECENCPHLDVTLKTRKIIAYMEGEGYQHTITCEHINECQLMKEYLRKEMQKDGN